MSRMLIHAGLNLCKHLKMKQMVNSMRGYIMPCADQNDKQTLGEICDDVFN